MFEWPRDNYHKKRLFMVHLVRQQRGKRTKNHVREKGREAGHRNT